MSQRSPSLTLAPAKRRADCSIVDQQFAQQLDASQRFVAGTSIAQAGSE
jgi:hypothetical protein